MVDENQVIEALQEVYDPEIPVNIVDLGLIYDIDIDDGAVEVKMTLTTMGCPMADQIFTRARDVVAQVDGVERVEVIPTWEPPWSPEKATEAGQQQLRTLGISF